MMKLYYRDADAALIVFDIGHAQSFEAIEYWVNEMENNCNNERKHFVLASAGNKCDIEDTKKQISMKEASEMQKKHGIIYHETSAKMGTGVNDLFLEMINNIIMCKRDR